MSILLMCLGVVVLLTGMGASLTFLGHIFYGFIGGSAIYLGYIGTTRFSEEENIKPGAR